MSGFDLHKSSTWSEEHQAVYKIGHGDGESCRDADWYFALLDVMPAEIAAAGIDHGVLVEWVRGLAEASGLSSETTT